MKEDNEVFLKKVQASLSKEMKSDAEKDALKTFFNSRQHQLNENIINEQAKFIQSLQDKCQNYEKELQRTISGELNIRI